ncbi:MAG: hypothetical protein GC191_16145 [Azospirillum sp.]|nr:hypothetical protein [Azospirillum sp.]
MLITLAESLKFDLDRAGVKIQVVNPVSVRTPMTARNDYPMPFLIGAEDAAARIADGLVKDDFEIAFPGPAAFAVQRLCDLPSCADFRLMR